MADTLADLYREVGLESPASRAVREGAPRPLPQRPQVNNPAARRYNEHRRAPQVRQDFAANASRQAYQPPRNQIAELPQLAFETTGIPSLGRAYQGYANATNTSDMQAANEQAINGALGVAGWAVPGLRGEAPLPPKAPFVRVGPSLADVVDAEGFTLGGSGSLAVRALRREGRMPRDESIFEQNMPIRSVPLSRLRGTDHTSPERQWVDYYTQNTDHEPVMVRRNHSGDYDLIDGHHRTEAARQRGATDIEALDASGYFYPSTITRAPRPFPDFGALPEATPSLRPPPRQIGANGMPIAEAQPFRNSMRGGSVDLAEAAGMRASPDGGPAPAGSSRQPMERLALSPEREAQLRSRTRDLEDNTPTDVRLRVDAMRQQAEMEKRMAGIENWPPERVAEFYRTLERMNPVAAERMLETLSRRVGELRMQEIFGSPRPPPNGAKSVRNTPGQKPGFSLSGALRRN